MNIFKQLKTFYFNPYPLFWGRKNRAKYVLLLWLSDCYIKKWLIIKLKQLKISPFYRDLSL